MSNAAQVINSLTAHGPDVYNLPNTEQATNIKVAFGQLMCVCAAARASDRQQNQESVDKPSSNKRVGRPRLHKAAAAPHPVAEEAKRTKGESTEAVLSKIGVTGVTMKQLQTRLPTVRPTVIGRCLSTAMKRGEVIKTDDNYYRTETEQKQKAA